MNTQNELKRACELLARIICARVDELSTDENFQAKEIKELTGIVKDLSAIERSMAEEADSSEVRVIFEGGDIKWAQ